jgi:cell division protease FtsH
MTRNPAPRRWLRLVPLFPLAMVAALLFARFVWTEAVVEVPYSTFVAQLDSGHIKAVVVAPDRIRATLRKPDAAGHTTLTAIRVDPGLVDLLRQRGVEFTGERGTRWFDFVLTWVLLPLLFLSLLGRLGRAPIAPPTMESLGFARSGAKVFEEKDITVTFDDVAGVDEAKAELREVVDFLKDPASFGRLGARIPRGILLVGPPGTGKTLLARAVAGESKVPFYSINGSEFVELFVGVGAARVRDLFARARQRAPCIIFIDEIDALGRTRAAGLMTGSNDEKEQTLHQLLAEMDGFTRDTRIILLAATNRPEILDPALLRAGRFDRQVLVDRPDRAGRARILRVHVKQVPLEADLDLDQVAALTPGFTGADLANLVNEAALTATRRGARVVAIADFTAAVERIVAGLEKKSRVLSPRERSITSYHEMGHAIVALATPGADPVHKVSIIPHGLGALGFTLQRPSEDRYIATRRELEDRMTVILGGRAAELVAFDELSTGASDDLVRATELAREMVMRHGMDATVGHVVYGEQAGAYLGMRVLVAPESRLYSEETAREIERAVRALVEQALHRAVGILRAHRAELDEGAALLLAKETLTREELPVLRHAVAVREETP